MKGIFSYDSGLMQALSFLWDLIVLNVLFVLCALPVVTLGASWAGLYSGIRVLRDKEDGRSCLRAFFRGFRTGFPQITVGFCVLLVPTALLALQVMAALVAGAQTVLLLASAALLLCALLASQMPPFHARFTCTAWQLLRNTCFISLANPLRALPSALLLMLPVVIALALPPLFLLLLPLWAGLYFSLHALLTLRLLRPPYAALEERIQKEG
ncbi:MAG: YesL family protein [Oscillospiraceae bacterium]|nr:YesL family protein [Oscillospiraceae bacterium]